MGRLFQLIICLTMFFAIGCSRTVAPPYQHRQQTFLNSEQVKNWLTERNYKIKNMGNNHYRITRKDTNDGINYDYIIYVSPSLVETMGDITFEPGLVDGKGVLYISSYDIQKTAFKVDEDGNLWHVPVITPKN